MSKDLAKRWKKPGDEKYTNIPGFIQGNQLLETQEGNKNMMDMWAQSDAFSCKLFFLALPQSYIGMAFESENGKKDEGEQFDRECFC